MVNILMESQVNRVAFAHYDKTMAGLRADYKPGKNDYVVLDELNKLYDSFPNGQVLPELTDFRKTVGEAVIAEEMWYINANLAKRIPGLIEKPQHHWSNSFEFISHKCEEIGLELPPEFEEYQIRYQNLVECERIGLINDRLDDERSNVYDNYIERCGDSFESRIKVVNMNLDDAIERAREFGLDVSKEAEEIRDEMFEIFRHAYLTKQSYNEAVIDCFGDEDTRGIR